MAIALELPALCQGQGEFFRGDYEFEELATCHPQEGFGKVHLQLMSSHNIEHHPLVLDVAFDHLSQMITEDCVHTALIICVGIFVSERHYCVIANT